MPTNQLWPADKPERRDVSSLRPFPRNARLHSPEQIAQIAASIREWGWTNAVLIDETGEIIAGHARVLAAQQMGLKKIPVIVARGWTDEQKRAYVLADNKLGLNASWDEALLRLEVGDLQEVGFDLGLAGFSEGDLANIFLDREQGVNDPDAEWQNMPGFHQVNANGIRVVVHFETAEDMAAFEKLVGQTIPKYRAIWFPAKPPERAAEEFVGDDASVPALHPEQGP